MTSGKSTLGPILANVLGLDFFDLDKEIIKNEGMTIVEIFEQKGEPYFRASESRMLELLSQNDDIVISLGGGTITNSLNYEMMKRLGKIIYLKVSAPTLYKRLRNKIDRPIFKDLVMNEHPEEDFLKRIEELLAKRKSYYEKADIILETESTPFGLIVDDLAKQIKHLYHEKN